MLLVSPNHYMHIYKKNTWDKVIFGIIKFLSTSLNRKALV
jgi:hypothetical protein